MNILENITLLSIEKLLALAKIQFLFVGKTVVCTRKYNFKLRISISLTSLVFLFFKAVHIILGPTKAFLIL